MEIPIKFRIFVAFHQGNDPAETIREWTQNHLTQLDYHGMRIDWLKPVVPLYNHVIDRSKIESW